MSKVTFIQISPEELQEEILKGVKSQIDDLKNHLQPQQSDEKYLTINQVAEKFSVSIVTISNWRHNGILKSFQIGGRIYFKLSDIEKSLIQISA